MLPHAPDAALALALLRLSGVGRAAAGRLLAAFPDAEALRACPREQVLVRLKRIPRAEAVAEAVQAGDPFLALLARAGEVLDLLASRRVTVLTARHPHWPAGLGALGWAQRPPVLWCYGNTAALQAPAAALLADPAHAPLSPEAFALAEGLPAQLPPGAATVCGAESGFDVAVAKQTAAAGRYAVMVPACGLARLRTAVRPVAQATVRAGGALVSPFDMDHGPYPHDARERALVQCAIARAAVAFEPPREGAEWEALAWAHTQGTPAYAVGEGPEGVERVGGEVVARLHQALGR